MKEKERKSGGERAGARDKARGAVGESGGRR
jgi:hypothetical protein